ncbi:uncharacterized protein LACBIDRAFT_305226 [Laccaria bicolor S238N-H82]|uniref:Predicted protein n=1 Tax=Laccaria bicolor (strain S238N-H82 / ATCC MYA-4686) TaxID=486041 RepID=B0CTQ7_LACBS|nr:uncharacterized protein LACBIDRAFT_305226 [Laccaria bicolor S238N-H82]EDR14536.1 predicted protein [Laccaria bicolor S238N-H82]|eukprot:XP_001875095.1 predicted protein [Laccaria bicolor S238N-H82]
MGRNALRQDVARDALFLSIAIAFMFFTSHNPQTCSTLATRPTHSQDPCNLRFAYTPTSPRPHLKGIHVTSTQRWRRRRTTRGFQCPSHNTDNCLEWSSNSGMLKRGGVAHNVDVADGSYGSGEKASHDSTPEDEDGIHTSLRCHKRTSLPVYRTRMMFVNSCRESSRRTWRWRQS